MAIISLQRCNFNHFSDLSCQNFPFSSLPYLPTYYLPTHTHTYFGASTEEELAGPTLYFMFFLYLALFLCQVRDPVRGHECLLLHQTTLFSFHCRHFPVFATLGHYHGMWADCAIPRPEHLNIIL